MYYVLRVRIKSALLSQVKLLTVKKASAFCLNCFHSYECRAPRALSHIPNQTIVINFRIGITGTKNMSKCLGTRELRGLASDK